METEGAECIDHPCESIAFVIRARVRDLGGFTVRRSIPAARRRQIGPFTFFDHMGPVTLAPGKGMDVRPHPHIALATVTYLFDGEILHRDNLGSVQRIQPGDVNWMVAGRGIAHSERTADDVRKTGQRLHGIQAWVALPKEHEETAPSFVHHPKATLPEIREAGVTLRVIAGTAFGKTSPVSVLMPTLYVDAELTAGGTVTVPSEHAERAFYVVSGAVTCEGDTFGEGDLVVLTPGANVQFTATTDTRVMILGGAPLDGPRFIWWNFVSSTEARIEQAKKDWKEGRFPKVPGDEVEFIPLPE